MPWPVVDLSAAGLSQRARGVGGGKKRTGLREESAESVVVVGGLALLSEVTVGLL